MPAIVGRKGERAAVDAFLADAAAAPRTLLVEGEPGIGKTTLLGELVAGARSRGYPVLQCQPARAEMDLSYVNLVEMLEGLPEALVAGLPVPQARLLRILLRREEPEGPFDSLSANVAVVAALRALAAAGPAVMVIDDIQWLDNSTARTLGFVARRLADTPVRIVVATRVGADAAPADRLAALSRAMPEGRFATLRLGPVEPSELSRILRLALGWAPPWPRLQRIAELSGGNPLYAVELARAMGGGEDEIGEAPAGGLVELARARVIHLPERVREVLELACVPPAPTVDLLRRLASGQGEVTEALAGAERAGIVTVDGDRVRFAHPILAAAVYGAMPTVRRRALHRAVAMLADDLEERARHLARAAAGPDAEVALALAVAAEQAWGRGAPTAAADLLGLSCELTPPSDVDSLGLRRVAYGRMLHQAGDTPGAVATLEAVVSDVAPRGEQSIEQRPTAAVRARALYHLMYVIRLSGDLEPAIRCGLRAVEESADDPSYQAECYEMLSRLSDNDIGRKLATARAGLAVLERIADPDPYVVFHMRAALMEAEFYAGLGIHLERLEGLDPGGRRQFPPVRTAPRVEDLIGRLLTYAGRIDEGLSVLRSMYDRAAVVNRGAMAAFLGWMAEGELMASRFEAVVALAREAIERTEEAGQARGNPWEVGFLAIGLAMLGRLDEAESAARGVVGEELDGTGPLDMDHGPALIGLGIAALSRDDFPLAVAALRLVDRAKREAGLRDPRLWAHYSDLVEALLGAAEPAEAAEVCRRFEEEAATSQGEWSLAAAARCRALVLAAQGDLDGALQAATRSLTLFDGLSMPFERARTLHVLGQVHRRRREKRLAREALCAAVDAFDELGAVVWARRARGELSRIPVRQAAEGLTPTEETIARLAAQGLSNREIADRAFLSPKTVEVNLTRVYRKLGVRSRAALASRLAATDGGQL
jgi:DNA-binding CsgD family transcriptional regulator